jgi:hypothetical protein
VRNLHNARSITRKTTRSLLADPVERDAVLEMLSVVVREYPPLSDTGI